VRAALLTAFAAACFTSGSTPALQPEPELLRYVAQIRQAQLDLLAVDDFVPCGDRASATAAISLSPRPFTSAPCWTRIGWAPDGPVRGGYWVEVAPDGQDFTVYGVASGPAGPIEVRATRETAAAPTRSTP